ncbi:TRAF3-interacting protein 1 isoform X5 [Histomonas meleagridis]|uniref:TRAF3-interacting protein 1 isoform X5 n=1 Tax=Histomonas meleagridis TaxID=135588 RepID=UPI003559A394|nr:TRAF3-interacting protein 1 isoform X5 [Histomonas meleagridis]KAH0798179.1 TRAF3-interacting protein 1 isoform X5 [Histomonas meleagridis]
MSSDPNLESLIESTIAVFKPYGKLMPSLDPKYFKRPPIKFLALTVNALHRKTKFADGLFTDDQFKGTLPERDDKLNFFKQLKEYTQIVLDQPIDVDPKAIASGKEVEKTLLFMQSFARAAENPVVSFDVALAKMKGGSAPPKESQPSKRPHKEEHHKSTEESSKPKEEDKHKHRPKESEKPKEDDKHRHRSKEDDKPKEEDKQRRRPKEDEKPKEEKPQSKEEDKHKHRPKEDEKPKEEERKRREEKPKEEEKPRKPKEEEKPKEAEKPKEEERKRREEKPKEEEKQRKPAPKEDEKPKEEEKQKQKPAKEEEPPKQQQKTDEEVNKRKEEERNKRKAREEEKQKRKASKEEKPRSKPKPQQEEIEDITEEASGPSITARKAPPKVRNESNVIVDAVAPQIIHEDDIDDDVDDIFVEDDGRNTTINGGQENGKLVKDILDACKQIGPDSAKKGDNLADEDRFRQGIELAKGLLQHLARSAQPLDILIQFSQEDLGNMENEYKRWAEECDKQQKILDQERLTTEQQLRELNAKIDELDKDIVRQEARLRSIKAAAFLKENNLMKQFTTMCGN